MKPPLRCQHDADAVIEGIVNGVVDAIATDHAPHPGSEKMQEFERCPFGITGPRNRDRPLARRTGPQRPDHADPHGRIVHHRARPISSNWTAERSRRARRPTSRSSTCTPNGRMMFNSRSRKAATRHFSGRRFRGGPLATIVGGEIVWNDESNHGQTQPRACGSA